VVPLRVTVGGAAYRDSDLPPADLVARFDEGVTTSAPAPGDFARVFADVPGEILVITVARRLSGTMAAAELAAADAGPRVRVLDGGTSAGSQALITLHAAAAARDGAGLAPVEAAARRAAGRVRLVAALGTLDYLVRGGRLPGPIGSLGSRLGVRPLVEVRAGRVLRRRPAFSKRAADERMVGMLLRSRPPGTRLHVIALHVLAEPQAQALLDRVRSEVEPETALVARFGPAMVAHTGPELTGLSWWWE